MELNKIYCESNIDTMSRMPDNFVDLTVTSPPYDNLRDYNGYSFPFENIAKELYRVTKQGGVLVWVVNDETINGSETLTSAKQKIFFREHCGFNIHDTMIWEKPGATNPSTTRYHQVFEYMFVLSKGPPKTFNGLKDRKNKWARRFGKGTVRSADGQMNHTKKDKLEATEFGLRNNVWYMNTACQENVCGKNEHPAPFSEELARDHILSWSKEGELVYDPFMGSGTTAKMALMLSRNFIGSELSKQYIDISEKRIAPIKSQQKLF